MKLFDVIILQPDLQCPGRCDFVLLDLYTFYLLFFQIFLKILIRVCCLLHTRLAHKPVHTCQHQNTEQNRKTTDSSCLIIIYMYVAHTTIRFVKKCTKLHALRSSLPKDVKQIIKSTS